MIQEESGLRRKNGERFSAMVDGARAKTHVGIGWDHARARLEMDWKLYGAKTSKRGPCGSSSDGIARL